MPVSLVTIRRFALALPDTTEEPHHQFGSFRVRGKIFVTIPPGNDWLHVFLPAPAREQALAEHPRFLEPVLWGGKVQGVRVNLAKAQLAIVRQLVRAAYDFKAATVPVRRPGGPGIDDYIASFPPEVQTRLMAIREAVRAEAPQAEEVISYRMPTFKQHGVLVHFAAFQHHIGLYPPVRGDAGLEAAAAPYMGEKGNLRFPLHQPIPLELIARITRHRLAQNLGKAKPGKRATKKAAG